MKVFAVIFSDTTNLQSVSAWLARHRASKMFNTAWIMEDFRSAGQIVEDLRTFGANGEWAVFQITGEADLAFAAAEAHEIKRVRALLGAAISN
jgi:hypothetical protein